MIKLFESLIYAIRPELLSEAQTSSEHVSTIFLEEVARDTGVQLTEEDLNLEEYDEIDLVE